MDYVRTIEAFLLNTSQNDQGWRVDMDRLKHTAKDWIGVNGILHAGCMDGACGYVHSRGRSLEDALNVSERDAVTRISDVYWENGNLMASHEVLDESKLPILCDDQIYATSASVWLDDPQQTDPIGSYTPVHVAWLSVNGAYGADAEVIKKDNMCANSYMYADSKDGMDDTPTDKKKEQAEGQEEKGEEEQQMTVEDMLKQIHSMVKAMAGQRKQEQASASSSCTCSRQKAAASKETNWAKQWVTPAASKQLLADDIPV